MAIVVGYIPTREGRAALRGAAGEAELRRARLILVNSERGGREDDPEQVAKFEADLAGVRAHLDGAGIEHEVRQVAAGLDAAEDLIMVAEESGAACIVIGLRRRTPTGKLILGSSAQRVLLDAPCPVLAVKADADD